VAFGAFRGAAVRPRTDWAVRGKPGALVPRAQDRPADRPAPAARPSACPEIDCVRHLLPRRVIAAAEHRARSIGLGADRVLIYGDAITEEAYLTALAAFLGTSYERLDDKQLIQAAAAGLLPLREGSEIVWIIAPRCLTARRLAEPRQVRPQCLRSFRLTSPNASGASLRNTLGTRSDDVPPRGCGSPGRFSPMRRDHIAADAS